MELSVGKKYLYNYGYKYLNKFFDYLVMASTIDNDFDAPAPKEEDAIKVIILGDSAVGKTKLMERFLLDKLFVQVYLSFCFFFYILKQKLIFSLIVNLFFIKIVKNYYT